MINKIILLYLTIKPYFRRDVVVVVAINENDDIREKKNL